MSRSCQTYPFLAYGTDWLAFAHLVIAVFFLGPLFNPTGHDWILFSSSGGSGHADFFQPKIGEKK